MKMIIKVDHLQIFISNLYIIILRHDKWKYSTHLQFLSLSLSQACPIDKFMRKKQGKKGINKDGMDWEKGGRRGKEL